MSMRSASVLAAVIGSGLVGAIISRAGPLDPPAGPVAPTYKTLTEVEPRVAINSTNTPGNSTCLFRITQPGSYYLTGNINGVSGKNGLDISASNVTVDLNGFTLSGVPGSGIGLTGAGQQVAVRNGIVKGWGQTGIHLGSFLRSSCQGVQAIGNGERGIVSGTGGLIQDCVACSNAIGIDATLNTIVRSCVVESNTITGIQGSQLIVENCYANANTLGISAGNYSQVNRCVVVSSAGDGIKALQHCRITENLCSQNGNTGNGANIHIVSHFNRIESNTLNAGNRGLDVDGIENFIVRNIASNNTVNYSIDSGNFGEYLEASASSTVNGREGGNPIGSMDPWMNFTY